MPAVDERQADVEEHGVEGPGAELALGGEPVADGDDGVAGTLGGGDEDGAERPVVLDDEDAERTAGSGVHPRIVGRDRVRDRHDRHIAPAFRGNSVSTSGRAMWPAVHWGREACGMRRELGIAVAAFGMTMAVAFAGCGAPLVSTVSAPSAVTTTEMAPTAFQAACPPAAPGFARCLALFASDAQPFTKSPSSHSSHSSSKPKSSPTPKPSPKPKSSPTPKPSSTPKSSPTAKATATPKATSNPTSNPTSSPTSKPSPTATPAASPTPKPSATPAPMPPTDPSPQIPGLHPFDLHAAYGLPAGGSGGKTIAVVDAMDDPNAEADMGVYRAAFGLPACTTANGCFHKIDGSGGTTYPAADAGWSKEITVDLDMVSAACPDCHILLVEAASADMPVLAAAENTAAASPGVVAISNSFGVPETSAETGWDASFHHPGIAITAAAGDSGYGTVYPAVSPYVTAVGGTSLSKASNARGWTETAWSGGGSGCSSYEPKPSWQTDTGCTTRTTADVAAVADPSTGVSVYDTYQSSGWAVAGGTSAASPIIAAAFVLAGNATAAGPSYPYSHTSGLNDITSGSNSLLCFSGYLCSAGPGYDGPTGLGTPKGTSAF